MTNDVGFDFIKLQIMIKVFLVLIIGLIIFLNIKKINQKISVIIPTYNRAHTIINSIKSVLNQTMKNLEIIVVDDGSKDNTKEKIDKIRDKRLRYIKLENNTGGSNARNIGIKKANGQFISFQDSDDIFYPEKLERQFKNMINEKSDFDFCKINVIFNSTYNYIIPNELQEKSILKGEMINELISRGNFISTQSILIKSKIMKEHLFDPRMPRLQDYDMILSMISKVKFSYTKEVLVDLRLQNDSLTHSPIKLQKAIHLLLNKSYNFNSTQKLLFSKYLNDTLKY